MKAGRKSFSRSLEPGSGPGQHSLGKLFADQPRGPPPNGWRDRYSPLTSNTVRFGWGSQSWLPPGFHPALAGLKAGLRAGLPAPYMKALPLSTTNPKILGAQRGAGYARFDTLRLTQAEDRAPQGCDLSADLGAGTKWRTDALPLSSTPFTAVPF